MKNVTVSLALERPSKKTGLAPIYVRVIIKSKKKDFHTGQRIPANKGLWDKKKCRVKSLASYPESRTIQAVTESKKAQIQDVVNKLEIAKKPVTFETIENGLHGGAFVPFVDYMRDLLEKDRSLGKIKESSAKSYEHALRHVENYNPKILLIDLTSKFLYGLQDHMLEQGITATTIGTYMKAIRKYINYAKRVGDIETDPLAKFEYIKPDSKEREFLTVEELRRVDEFFHSCEAAEYREQLLRKDWFDTMQYSLQAFLFGCYSGLRYSDVSGLMWGDLKENMIRRTLKKTNKPVRIPYNSGINRLVNVHEDHDPEELVFPGLPTHATINRRLKEAMDILGITKHISFHCSRHTFATSALTAGMDLNSVAQFLGHQSVQTTKIYARLVDKKVFSEMDKFDRFVQGGDAPKPQGGGEVKVVKGKFRKVG